MNQSNSPAGAAEVLDPLEDVRRSLDELATCALTAAHGNAAGTLENTAGDPLEVQAAGVQAAEMLASLSRIVAQAGDCGVPQARELARSLEEHKPGNQEELLRAISLLGEALEHRGSAPSPRWTDPARPAAADSLGAAGEHAKSHADQLASNANRAASSVDHAVSNAVLAGSNADQAASDATHPQPNAVGSESGAPQVESSPARVGLSPSAKAATAPPMPSISEDPELLADFIVESRDHLAAIEANLLVIERDPGDTEAIHAVFRGFHTIKGLAGFLDLPAMQHVAHEIETLLDHARDGQITLGSALIDVILEGADYIRTDVGRVAAALAGGPTSAASPSAAPQTALIAKVRKAMADALRGGAVRGSDSLAALFAVTPPGSMASPGVEPSTAESERSASPGPATRANPGAGTTVRVWTPEDDAMTGPAATRESRSMASPGRPTRACPGLGTTVSVQTPPEEGAMTSPPVTRESEPRASPGRATTADAGDATAASPWTVSWASPDADAMADLGRVTRANSGEGTAGRLEGDKQAQPRGVWEGNPIANPVGNRGGSAVRTPGDGADGSASTPVAVAAPGAPAGTGAEMARAGDTAAAQRAAAESGRLVKVATGKLDSLVDMIGELVIAQSMIHHDSGLSAVSSATLQRNLAQLGRITADVQKTAMSMRMVPVGQLFQKSARIVRDLTRQSGKLAELELIGEDTQLDRTIVEELADPLLHMVRNSADHGIETPAERTACGKPAAARIGLKAYHRAGHIVIEVSDDGRGLAREKILAKARERGLVAPGAELTDKEVFNLIFEPGFSTAEKITNVSGRGVGLDVVRKQMQKLRGRIDIESRPGQGTTFILKLPLTLAIIDGLVVGVGKERFILPIYAVEEMFRPRPDAIFTVENRREMVLIRGGLLPVVRLHRRFSIATQATDLTDGVLVVAESGEKRFCLAVDQLLGKQEVVIKNLGPMFKNVPGVAGGAILGDGRVGLILDMDGLFQESRCA